MKRLILFLAIVLAFSGILGWAWHSKHAKVVEPVVPSGTPAVVSAPTRAELLALTNQERQANGLPTLPEDPRLDTSAQQKADDEFTNHYIAHISPFTGQHGYELAHAAYPTCPNLGENLTENTIVNDSQHAVNAWINSPPHHAAMINPKTISVGFGVAGDEVVAHYCNAS